MSDEVRAEYEEMLARVVWKIGQVVCEDAGIYGWVDWQVVNRTLRLSEPVQTVAEAVFSELYGETRRQDV